MKTLVKFFFVLFLVTFTSATLAQTFGVKAGWNLSDILLKDDIDTYSDQIDMKMGFHVGPTAEFLITDAVSFETGLILSTKGYKINYSETFGGQKMEMKGEMNLYYLDIPLTVKAYFDAGNARLFGTFGPYVSTGLFGKAKSEMTTLGVTEKEKSDVNWGSKDEDDLKRFDYGLTAGVGVAINAFEIGVSYGYGLANISSYTDNGYTMRNKVLGVSMAYKLGRE